MVLFPTRSIQMLWDLYRPEGGHSDWTVKFNYMEADHFQEALKSLFWSIETTVFQISTNKILYIIGTWNYQILGGWCTLICLGQTSSTAYIDWGFTALFLWYCSIFLIVSRDAWISKFIIYFNSLKMQDIAFKNYMVWVKLVKGTNCRVMYGK